jgi:hypothetical protein
MGSMTERNLVDTNVSVFGAGNPRIHPSLSIHALPRHRRQ